MSEVKKKPATKSKPKAKSSPKVESKPKAKSSPKVESKPKEKIFLGVCVKTGKELYKEI